MSSSVRYFIARGLNGTGTTSLYQTVSNTTGGNATTLQLMRNVAFIESKSVQTARVILTVINVLASAATAGSILYDCYSASKQYNSKFKASFGIPSIPPAETFPLILANGTIIQGIIFAAVLAQGFDSPFTRGCSIIAHFMWPAIMLVPYIQFVFGIECTLRSIRRIPFQARGKYEVTMCCVTIVLMLIASWILSHVFREDNLCFASLVWFLSGYGKLELAILSIIGGFLMISAVTIFTRLSTVTMIDPQQRLAASRTVYYLILGTVSLVFTIPLFVSLTMSRADIKALTMAAVFLNLPGLMTGLLYLFLRLNTSKDAQHWNGDEDQIRICGPNDVAFRAHLVDPISGPQTPIRGLESRAQSRTSLLRLEKDRVVGMESLGRSSFSLSPRLNPVKSSEDSVEEKATMPTNPEPVAEPLSANRAHARVISYNSSPAEMTSSTEGPSGNFRTVESVYDISGLTPPPPIFGPEGWQHRRSSIASSATVQIGLRLSHGLIASMEDIPTVALSRTTYDGLHSTTTNVKVVKPMISVPLSTFNTNAHSPLKPRTQNINISELPVQSLSTANPLNTKITSTCQASPSSTSSNLLPVPTPKILDPVIRESNTQLSQAVYSPKKEVPVRSMSARTATTKPAFSSRDYPLGNGSPAGIVRSNSDREPAKTENKNNWI